MEAAKSVLCVWSGVAPLRHQRAQIAGGLEPMQVIGKGNSSRWILDAFDRAALEHAFRLDPFPNASARQQLGLELNVSPRQIQVWFQNRRQREKLQNAGRLPNTHRVDSPRGTDVPFAGMKQKRDFLHMLQDMQPATVQMQMQQQLTNAQAQLLTQATTFRVLSADPRQPVAGVQPIIIAASPQTSPPASPPAEQQQHKHAPEPKRANNPAVMPGGPWLHPSAPWVRPDDGLMMLSTGARHRPACILRPPAHVVNREPSPSPAPTHAQLTPCSLLAQSPPASDITRLIIANLACEVFQTVPPPPPAAFGLSLFTRWRTREKGRIPMIRLAIGRSDARMGEASKQSEGRVLSSDHGSS